MVQWRVQDVKHRACAQVVDHEEVELAKQLSAMNGEIKYIDTAQGFRLTEVRVASAGIRPTNLIAIFYTGLDLVWKDEFNFKVPWELRGEEKDFWDKIPDVSKISKRLQQQNNLT